MKKKKKLTNFDIITIEKNFPIYYQMKYIEMFVSLFKKFSSQKKLDCALEHVDYQPFKDAINNHDYDFFHQLLEALPQERYKKLMLMHHNYQMIELFFSSLIDYSSKDLISKTSILKVWNNIVSLVLEEVVKSYSEDELSAVIINKDNHRPFIELLKNNEEFDSLLGKRVRIDDTDNKFLFKKQKIAGIDHDDNETTEQKSFDTKYILDEDSLLGEDINGNFVAHV